MDTQALLKAMGPLASLYKDPQIAEFMVDAPDRVMVVMNDKLEASPTCFDSTQALETTILSILEACGVKTGPEQTIYDVRVSKEDRMLVVFPPTALEGPYLVLRKFRPTALNWDKLLSFDFITQEALDLLRKALRNHQSILAAGGTGSGKTTFMNLLVESIAPEERVVVVENIHELQIKHPRAIFLEAGAQAGVKMEELLTTGSKMWPDWMVIGELCGPEAMRAIELLARGHTGITTTHSNSPEDALARLEAMCLMANLGLGLGEIRNLIASAFRIITHQEYLQDGSRKLQKIVEITGLENDRYLFKTLYER